ncbi:hypothetical protein QTH91_02555 [Variovorax dokdonensis]|uniref:Surface antigen domain-containing protein n=1 Tax=Variovorax dokdonensis TaxID=344883 RepID=A0ABT7N624_9BURK|nr:hypothetical protein [Variovorax dokdonensis]MDM0043352.1 hypothetical protein [Variovorax dokdonensis]
MKHACCRQLMLGALFATLAAAPAAADLYASSQTASRAWSAPSDPQAERLAIERDEASRLSWLRASPIGSRDFCSSYEILGVASNASADLVCMRGTTTARELQANGWELTDAQETFHFRPPGTTVKVMQATSIKRKCVAEDGTLRGPLRGRFGCAPEHRDGDWKPALLWLPEGSTTQ